MGTIICLSDARRKRSAERRENPTAYADALSFMRKRKRREGGGIEYWAVESSGSYSTDCDIGKQLGKEFLAYIGNHPTIGNATLFTWIVCQRQEFGTSKGLQVGFLEEIGSYAMFAAAAFAGKIQAR